MEEITKRIISGHDSIQPELAIKVIKEIKGDGRSSGCVGGEEDCFKIRAYKTEAGLRTSINRVPGEVGSTEDSETEYDASSGGEVTMIDK